MFSNFNFRGGYGREEDRRMDIGKRIRQLRIRNGLTQAELASRCELTKGFVSQLENNLATPSLPALMDLVEALGSDMSAFFSEEKETRIVFGKDDFFEDERDNVTISWAMEPIILTIQPRQASQHMMPHEGEEFGLVLSGTVQLVNGVKKHRIRKGETFYIRGEQEHYLANETASPARVLWITTPPLF